MRIRFDSRTKRFRLIPKKWDPRKRVAGRHDVRLDGMSDLLLRARDAKVLDVGCNRGLVGYEFANNGASLVHGVDYYEPGIVTAREIFNDIPAVSSRFEVADLTKGPSAMASALGSDYTEYDIVLLLAVDQKLLRIVSQSVVDELMTDLAKRTKRYFAYRGFYPDNYEKLFEGLGLKRVHYSDLATKALGAPAVIWERQ